MAKLTKRAIDALDPTSGRTYLWDEETRGFGVLSLPSGVKSFILQYRNAAGRSRRLTLGRYGVLTVDEARNRAKRELGRITEGADPVLQRRDYREAPTMNDLLDRYIAEHLEPHNAASTAKDVKSLIEKHVRRAVGGVKVNDFKRADAARLHHGMRETPRRANHALAILSKALALAEVWGLRPENSNPCGSIARFAEIHRERFLSADEVKRLGDALAEAETTGLPWRIDEAAKASKRLPKEENRRTPLSWQAIAAIRLLLLTGARLSEITSLKWTDVDAKAGTIALPGKKGGKRRPHPVGAAVLALIDDLPRVKDSPFLLPRASDRKRPISTEVMENAWARLRWRAGIEDVRIHDLRHTVGTYAAQAGVSSFIVRDLLRHRNINTTARYANFDADPVRNVSDAVAGRIAASLRGPEPSGDAPPDDDQ